MMLVFHGADHNRIVRAAKTGVEESSVGSGLVGLRVRPSSRDSTDHNCGLSSNVKGQSSCTQSAR
jgi:hypothetical protein